MKSMRSGHPDGNADTFEISYSPRIAALRAARDISEAMMEQLGTPAVCAHIESVYGSSPVAQAADQIRIRFLQSGKTLRCRNVKCSGSRQKPL